MATILTAPLADWLHTLTPGAAPGDIVLDYQLAPDGDLQLVAGSARLRQRIILWLLTPQGSNPFNPQYGNPLLALLGRPNDGDGDLIAEMVERCETYFLTTQQQDAAAGQLAADELVDHFDAPQVAFPLPGQVIVTVTVYAVSGDRQTLSLPLSITVGG